MRSRIGWASARSEETSKDMLGSMPTRMPTVKQFFGGRGNSGPSVRMNSAGQISTKSLHDRRKPSRRVPKAFLSAAFQS